MLRFFSILRHGQTLALPDYQKPASEPLDKATGFSRIGLDWEVTEGKSLSASLRWVPAKTATSTAQKNHAVMQADLAEVVF